MRRVRGWLAETRIRRQCALVVSCAVAAGVLILVLDGQVLAAVALAAGGVLCAWLSSLWVVPGGRDAYYSRTATAINTWLQEVGYWRDEDRVIESTAAARKRIAKIRVPEDLSAQRAEVLAALEEYEAALRSKPGQEAAEAVRERGQGAVDRFWQGYEDQWRARRP